MIKHYCDKCNKYIDKIDVNEIKLGYTHEFCRDCYNKIFDFMFEKEEVEDDN